MILLNQIIQVKMGQILSGEQCLITKTYKDNEVHVLYIYNNIDYSQLTKYIDNIYILKIHIKYILKNTKSSLLQTSHALWLSSKQLGKNIPSQTWLQDISMPKVYNF